MWMIYPEDKFKNFWDLLMTIVLLTACITTPLEIAFTHDSSVSVENPLSLVIDILFLVDMILIFNTAYYDEN
jgi:maltodextrin utilization protein YvdJ